MAINFDSARATELLCKGIGRPDAQFRDGQVEAIEHVVTGRSRLLVVQKTGWGKSSVYFIATKLLREQGAGITPLSFHLRLCAPAREMKNEHTFAQHAGDSAPYCAVAFRPHHEFGADFIFERVQPAGAPTS